MAEATSLYISEIHTSPYSLAEKWGFDQLKRLALFKLHKHLCFFSFMGSKLEHVIDFVWKAVREHSI